jgi:hypothetical protein
MTFGSFQCVKSTLLPWSGFGEISFDRNLLAQHKKGHMLMSENWYFNALAGTLPKILLVFVVYW